MKDWELSTQNSIGIVDIILFCCSSLLCSLSYYYYYCYYTFILLHTPFLSILDCLPTDGTLRSSDTRVDYLFTHTCSREVQFFFLSLSLSRVHFLRAYTRCLRRFRVRFVYVLRSHAGMSFHSQHSVAARR